MDDSTKTDRRILLMFEAEDRERGEQKLVSLREIRGPRERLTDAQRDVLAGLASSYTVCMSNRYGSVPYQDQVLIGNGSRLSPKTIESLQERRLIEVAGSELEPCPSPKYPEHWRRKLLFFQLTVYGWDTVTRQHLHFTPMKVVFSLPYRVALVLQEIERYKIRYRCEPEVAIRGVVASEQLGWQVHLRTWRPVMACNEADNLLGIAGRESGEENAALLWVRPEGHRCYLTSSARVQLHPARTSCPFPPGS